jgi:hypothetical protein
MKITTKVLKEAAYLLKTNLYAKINNDPDFPDVDAFLVSRVLPKAPENRIFKTNEELKEGIEAMQLQSVSDIQIVHLQKYPFVQVRGKREEILKELETYKSSINHNA